MGGGGALRDLCLHTVPCEVYQVLMKYIGLLETQAPQHSVCCGKSVQQPDQHQQRQPPPPPPPPPPTVTTTMTATAATTEAPPATTAATEAPKTAAASQPEGVCAAAAGSPAPAPTQAPGLRGESEPLFESEVVEGSCSSQDMALALPLGGAGLGGTHVGAGTEGRAAGASQGQEQLSEVFGLLPEALGNALARSAASQASQESVSLLAECGAVLGPGRAEQDSRVAEQAERRGGGVGRARERAGVGHRTATAAQTEVEKENVGGPAPREASWPAPQGPPGRPRQCWRTS
ncbi:E3 ubiquitin-protein ligase MARCHF11-like [Scylla paramamosain]|uniref:E3 ubiquitin-protein ligase MARCHF11-like n=1 Tax=Scylla paramamosain TaxID=85552 RepID=UPI0030836CC1